MGVCVRGMTSMLYRQQRLGAQRLLPVKQARHSTLNT
jgi:hypothetical protein